MRITRLVRTVLMLPVEYGERVTGRYAEEWLVVAAGWCAPAAYENRITDDDKPEALVAGELFDRWHRVFYPRQWAGDRIWDARRARDASDVSDELEESDGEGSSDPYGDGSHGVQFRHTSAHGEVS